MTSKLWDISPVINDASPVWPGDTPFTHTQVWQLNSDCPVNVAKLSMSAHTGAHADAPRHYIANGACIAEVSLDTYLGECYVIHVMQALGQHITFNDIHETLPARLPKRVLFRTYHQAPQVHWDAQFKAIDAALIEYLAGAGVKLIGVDTPSLDPQDSKSMDAHQMIAKHEMAILEGLILDDIDEGFYELIALPLKLKDMDASPVRAILRKINTAL